MTSSQSRTRPPLWLIIFLVASAIYQTIELLGKQRFLRRVAPALHPESLAYCKPDANKNLFSRSRAPYSVPI
jgi:hypothetical protein